MDGPHILYVGTDPDAVGKLSSTGLAESVLSVAQDEEAAQAVLRRGPVDRIVCEHPLPEAVSPAFLARAREAAPGATVVLRTHGEPSLPPDLYDETRLAGSGTVGPTNGTDGAGGPGLPTELPIQAAEALAEFPEYVAHVRSDGTLLWVNAAVTEGLGVPRETLVGTPLEELIEPAVAAEIQRAGREAIERGTILKYRGAVDDRNYRAIYAPVDGDCFEVAVRDTTAQRHAQQAFHEEQAFLEAVIDGLADVFFVTDLTEGLVRWNDRLVDVTNRDKGVLAGADPATLFLADAAAVRDWLDTVVAEGTETVELEVEADDGATYEFTGSLVDCRREDAQYVCAIGRDVSDRLATERELARSNEELERFAYVVSHDMKEPLRMVSSYLQLLDRRYEDDLDEDAREFVDYAVDGAERMRQMIDDLLTYSRAGRGDTDLEHVDCGDVLGTVRRNLRVALDENDADLVADDLPTVVGVRNQLVQLFQNLVDNAIKHAEDSPTIKVTAKREDRGWAFEVADDGPGIPPDEREEVFELFSGSDDDSTGIGLAVCRKIVERHGGAIDVESTDGKGTTVRFTLPATHAEAGMAGENAPTENEH